MTEAVRKYRKDHPKCAYCLHIESKTDLSGANKFCWCQAKMKSISGKGVYQHRPFCTCYDVRDEK